MPVRRRPIAIVSVLLALVAVAAQSAQGHRIVRHRGVVRYMGHQPNPSIFGIDTGSFDAVRSHYRRDFQAAQGLHGRWDRFTLSSATAAGNFSGLDDEVTRARKHHMGVVLSFQGISGACSKGSSNVQRCAPTTSGDLSHYQAYVRRVVLHYRKVVSYYESWIEANHNTSELSASQYAALVKAEHAVLQSVNRRYHLHLKLLLGSMVGFSIGPATSNWTAVLPFTSEVLADLHGARAFDGVALHGYRFPPVPPSQGVCDYVAGASVTLGTVAGCSSGWRKLTWPEELQAYEQLFSDAGYGQPPLWLTEFGWPGNAQANGAYFPSYDDQAADVREAYADLLQLPFVRGALWFNLRDYQPGYVSPDPAFFYHYGLLNYDYSAKPAGSAFTALARANPHR